MKPGITKKVRPDFLAPSGAKKSGRTFFVLQKIARWGGIICGVGFVGIPGHGTLVPSLAQQIQMVHQLHQDTQLLERVAAHVTYRVNNFRTQFQQQEALRAQMQQRVDSLKSRWPTYIQLYLHAHVRKQWQSPLTLGVDKRRQLARQLWASESFARVATDQLKDLESQLTELKTQRDRLAHLEPYFLSIEDNVKLRFRALEAMVSIRHDVLKTLKLPGGTSAEGVETLVRVRKSLELLVQKFSEGLQPEPIDFEKQRPLPVLTLMSESESLQSTAEGMKFMAAAGEPVAAIASGTVKYVSITPEGVTLGVKMSDDRQWVMTGLGQVFVQPEMPVMAAQVVGQAAEQGGWITVKESL